MTGPPPGAAWRVKEAGRLAGGLPDHGVIWATLVSGPQVGGLLNTACSPPMKLSWKLVKGTCGISVIFVVSRPVTGSAKTWPTSRTSIP